jgi:hypothetical protein
MLTADADEQLNIVMEYAACGSLGGILKVNNGQSLDRMLLINSLLLHANLSSMCVYR